MKLVGLGRESAFHWWVRRVDWLVSVQSMREMGKDFCPNLLLPFLESIHRRSCNDGCLFEYFTTLTEKANPLLQR